MDKKEAIKLLSLQIEKLSNPLNVNKMLLVQIVSLIEYIFGKDSEQYIYAKNELRFPEHYDFIFSESEGNKARNFLSSCIELINQSGFVLPALNPKYHPIENDKKDWINIHISNFIIGVLVTVVGGIILWLLSLD